MADAGAHRAPDDLVELGRIVSAYGVRGWVKVQPHSAQGLVLRAAPVWWLSSPPSIANNRSANVVHSGTDAGMSGSADSHSIRTLSSGSAGKLVPYPVKQSRPQGSTVVADLEGIADRDIAEAMRGYTVHVSRQYFPKAQADEFYWVDLVGCYVFSDGLLVGIVDEVVDNGAHAILRMHRLQLEGDQTPSDTHIPQAILDPKGRPQEVLVPFVAAHVQHVDIQARRIETDWPLDL
ncbi:ribosome maturation factor RimM [Zwartia sp.]|uniref:ribosome maturation factor RimM n=1 Tax=Zwartia sp. TaxID=2978004 RepID=UPI0027225F9F|nr:ribosome maturation factor RimM [Zwartia sp.]MDO9025470.1 ribosome maturation factor RimM [Zwartia sp.]